MSEEQQEQGGGLLSNLKAQIATGAGVILTGIGTMFMDEVKSFIGIEDEEPAGIEAPAQNNNQNVSVEGPTINLTLPQQQATQTIIREVPAEPETVKVEEPKATNRLLKYKKDS
jgi:hypothetical protein